VIGTASLIAIFGGPVSGLPGLPGSTEFMAAYQAALDGVTLPKPEITAPRTTPGTVDWLVSAYLSSATFKALAPETQRTRANILENFRKEKGGNRIFYTENGKPKMLLARHQQQVDHTICSAQFPQHAARNVQVGGE